MTFRKRRMQKSRTFSNSPVSYRKIFPSAHRYIYTTGTYTVIHYIVTSGIYYIHQVYIPHTQVYTTYTGIYYIHRYTLHSTSGIYYTHRYTI